VGDEELVQRMLRGDSWAKEAFYRKHVAQAYRVARRLVGTIHDTEDVVQEAFAQAFVDLPRLRKPEALRGWFLRIVVNRAHRKFRKRKVLSFLGWGADFEYGSYEESPECSPEVAMELRLSQHALAHAPGDARACWVLRRVEGCSLTEVAEACIF
jgi:RNA polymerase sigma-70 factor (ECF subfamily)